MFLAFVLPCTHYGRPSRIAKSTRDFFGRCLRFFLAEAIKMVQPALTSWVGFSTNSCNLASGTGSVLVSGQFTGPFVVSKSYRFGKGASAVAGNISAGIITHVKGLGGVGIPGRNSLRFRSLIRFLIPAFSWPSRVLRIPESFTHHNAHQIER